VAVNTFDGTAQLVRGSDGAVAWRIRDSVASHAPAVGGDRLYYPGYDGVLRVRAARDGTLLWQRRNHGALTLPPVPEGGLAIVASREGEVVALDSGNGKHRWSCTADRELVASPRLDRGRLLLFTGEGVMAVRFPAVETRDGRRLKRRSRSGKIFFQPEECKR